MKVQRLRVTFARGEEMKYITHLDLMRFWERALRRAGLPLAYSEGFSPHAQIALAAPLPVGTTSDAELMDVFMAERIAPKTLMQELAPQLPAGISIISAEEAGMALPALQADVRFAEYVVDVAAARCDRDVEAGGWKVEDGTDVSVAVERFRAAESIPWEHKREDEVKSYDIRSQVEEIELIARDGEAVRLRLRLKNDSSGSGRPEQVIAALGLPAPTRIHRTKLILAGASPSREAWRKRAQTGGRFAG
jgi:radical SAM-linked protein